MSSTFVDRPAAVGEVAEAELPVAERRPGPSPGSLSASFLPTGPSTTASASLPLLNRKGRSKSAELLDVAGEEARVQHRQVDRAALHRRDGLQVAAELTAREQPDLDLAAALLLDELGELLRTRPCGCSCCVLEREAQRPLLDLAPCGERREQQRRADEQRGEEVFMLRH